MADSRKVIWITGAGTGIGRACVDLLARDGHRLVLSGRRAALLEDAAAAARKLNPACEILVARADLSIAAQAHDAVKAITTRFGRLDAAVVAAGVNVTPRMWHELSIENLDYLLDGNLRNQLYTAHAALPVMRRQKDGLFVFVSSMAGRHVAALSGPIYTTTKHGVTAMSHTINVEECGNNIRSCCVLPGEVDTPMLAQRPKKLTPDELARVLKPEDVAEVVRFALGTPAHVCLNEIWVTPTHNRGYLAQLGRGA
jgi:NADP-dependent 3-hydroxy acid dehydrogenase YdfG